MVYNKQFLLLVTIIAVSISPSTSSNDILNYTETLFENIVKFIVDLSENIFLNIITKEDNEKYVISTPSGVVKGKTIYTWTNKTILSFLGLPYAEPPLGNLRFKPPVSVKPWDTVKDATKNAKVCIQEGSATFGPAFEDCLYLNVYTKNVKEKYSVVVFFHPGAFFSGTSSSHILGPQYILDRDVVLVTANYRLDALGFLSTGDKTSVGNYGMKDQVEVLKWVQKHISSFGGNQSDVTIAGYGAGGSSAFLHMMSPMSKGLFNRIIAMSGGLTSDWVVTKDPLPNANRLAKLLNCSTDSSDKMVQCLKNLPAKEINSRYEEQRIFAGLPLVRFGPVIEPDLRNGEERFLTDDPVSLIKKKQFHSVPVVMGLTYNELIGWAEYVTHNDSLREELSQNFDSLAPQIFGYSNRNTSDQQRITETFKEFYFGNEPITKSQNSTDGLGKLISDYLIIYGVHITGKLLKNAMEDPIYLYFFSYGGRHVYVNDPNSRKLINSFHYDDLLYLLPNSKYFKEFKESDPEAFMVKTEISFWYNFISKGDPTPDGSSLQWTPLIQNHKKISNYLEISEPLKVGSVKSSPFTKRLMLWENLFPVI